MLTGVRWDYWDAKAHIDFPTPVANLSDTSSTWNPRLGLVLEPTKNQMYYFTYGTSSNPSSEILSQTLNAANQNLDPEKNESFELGAKWTLFGKIGINTALFRIEKTNARTTDPATGLVELEGKQRVDGFEISAAGEILKGWQIFTGYTYLNPQIVEAVDVQNGVPIQGNYLPNVPQSSATLWTTYNFTWHCADPGRGRRHLCEQAVRERLKPRVIAELSHRRPHRGCAAIAESRVAFERPELSNELYFHSSTPGTSSRRPADVPVHGHHVLLTHAASHHQGPDRIPRGALPRADGAGYLGGWQGHGRPSVGQGQGQSPDRRGEPRGP